MNAANTTKKQGKFPKIVPILIIVAIFCVFSLFGSARPSDPGTSGSTRLDDGAGLLSPAERERVLSSLDYYSEKYEMDFVIVTVNSTGHQSDAEYADDYYDYHDYYNSGALLLIVTQTGSRYISTKGACEDVIDPQLDRFTDEVSTLLRQHRYEDAFRRYGSLCGECAQSVKNSGTGFGIVFVLALGLICAVVATSIMKGKLRSVWKKPTASDYTVKGSMQLAKKQDFFLYRNVTRVARPKNTSSSGGHYSSSGSHHGGGHI